MASTKNALACVECRSSKRKCQFDGGLRCVLCERRDLECLMVSDGRKDRPQNRRVLDLEHKIKNYRSMAKNLRQSLDQASHMLKTIENDRFQSTPQEGELSDEVTPSFQHPAIRLESPINALSMAHKVSAFNAQVRASESTLNAPRKYFQAKTFQNANPISVSVYGPTSIFDSESLPYRALPGEHRPVSLSKDPRIIECIKLFFRWLYPDMHAFIFREAFLLDFFDPESLAVYSSTELVYAICSVGALTSDDPDIKYLAPHFYRMSRDHLLASIDFPSISSLQAYLLLGLYDIYNFRNNAGWMLTGDALRMGLGIGFHLRPERWLVGNKKDVSEITISVRSRIFWGCFMVDRFVSLILGRPSVIKPDGSTIHVSDNMPSIEWIQPYTYPGAGSEECVSYIDISNPLGSIIKLAEISDNMMATVFADESDVSSKLELVKTYNRRIMRWRADLPENLRWDRSLLREKGHDTTKMFTRYYFYIILLCLNRPFVNETHNEQPSVFNSLLICMESIADVHTAMYSFVKAHGARRCSILIVYSCIIGASILLLNDRTTFTESQEEKDYFFDFMEILMEMSSTWKLSEKSLAKLRATLKARYGLDYEAELQKHLLMRKKSCDPLIYQLLRNSGNNVVLEDQRQESTEPEESPEFGGPGDPSAWSSLFPDFFSSNFF